jgi:uncharacterized protein (DUF849 family)
MGAMDVQRMQACLNGGRSQSDHPAVPLTPAELATAAAEAVAAGAEALHLHPRAADGTQSVLAADVGAAVAAVRTACPGTPVGVSTGLWITAGDPVARHTAVRAWAGLAAASKPDYASVNLCEAGSAELPAVLEAAGIATEAGVWSVPDVALLDRAEPPSGWLRIVIEILRTPAESAVAAANDVLHEVREANAAVPVHLHGENESCWLLISHAGSLGLPTRIGLEDTLERPDGTVADGNGELVTLGLAAWGSAGLL